MVERLWRGLTGADRLVAAVAVASAVASGVTVALINRRDQAQVPADDTADAVATLAVVGAAAVLLVTWRFLDPGVLAARLARGLALGVLAGALVTGLGSVIWDPWAASGPPAQIADHGGATLRPAPT